jgi:hypothetical protein
MRLLSVLCGVLLLCSVAFGQTTVVRGPAYWGCQYGCAPFVPLVSTPMISFQTVSSSPVGATNATGGLTAGASNSTLESLPADTNTDHTQVVWYWGANTLPTPATETALVPMRHPMMEHMEHMVRMEHHGQAEGAVYIAGPVESVNMMESSAGARNARKATRTYTNQDIDRVNQQTGVVKYDSKTEKIQ